MGVLKEQSFEQLIPTIKDWPIAKFSENRSNFAYELSLQVVEFFKDYTEEEILDLLEKTTYLENKRVKNKPWKVDPKDERLFWEKISSALKTKSEGENMELYQHLLKKIVTRYTEEILGFFKPKTHRFARNFLYRFFNLIFNKRFVFANKKADKLKNKLKLSGHTEEVRALFDKGTVVLVPTHYSNLDSIFIGFVMDYLAGIPASSYGAGLNLFDYEIPAYYMNRLGAYKIDRRKNNRIYRTTLLEMSSLSLQHGVNSLFFPGGGRSRSGSVETNLKFGLLSSLLNAQVNLIKNKSDKKIFVVPVTFGYHFVLEARSLIEEYLKAEGRSKYIRSKKKPKVNSLKMLRKLYSKDSEAFVRVGEPMDVLGFSIDENGKSIDNNGIPFDLKGFFEEEGEVVMDKQRESVYTRKLAKAISNSYHVNNVVLSSHLVAYVAFNILQQKNEEHDVYTIVNLSLSDLSITKDDFRTEIEKYKTLLLKMESENLLKLEPIFFESTSSLIEKGLRSVGTYHSARPLYMEKSGRYYRSEDYKTLFYYYNKLVTYDLESRLA